LLLLLCQRITKEVAATLGLWSYERLLEGLGLVCHVLWWRVIPLRRGVALLLRRELLLSFAALLIEPGSLISGKVPVERFVIIVLFLLETSSVLMLWRLLLSLRWRLHRLS